MAHQRSNNAYHQQNDMLEDELSKKTSRLKQIAIKIGDEARFQNEMLSKMVVYSLQYIVIRLILGR